jgi:hypothetical protein
MHGKGETRDENRPHRKVAVAEGTLVEFVIPSYRRNPAVPLFHRSGAEPEIDEGRRDTGLVIDHLDLLSHVSLLRGGQQPYTSLSFSPPKLTQKAPRAEPKSLRSLQAEKESVLFAVPVTHFDLSFQFSAPQRSSLYGSLYIFLSSLIDPNGYFPGDGNPSNSQCSHCSSSGSQCVFTESTKV